jgi:hypothetical protein
VTEGERISFNGALDKVQKLEWRDRVQRRLQQRVDALASPEAIALLRKIEELL